MQYQLNVALQIHQFYINYEECKFTVEKLTGKPFARFILTMRNVNERFCLDGIVEGSVLY